PAIRSGTILGKIIKQLFLIALVALASGCTSWSEERCTSADWERIGEDDGDAGRTPDYFDRYVERCAPHGIGPDRDAYLLGYTGGRDDYCTVRGGLDAGRDGRTYRGICDAGFEEDFLSGYAMGKRLLQIDQQITAVSSRLRQFELELSHNASLTDERRSYYLNETLRLRRELARAEDDRRFLERRAAKMLAE
ncbi:MAG: DUF2799 domain-containing protein, partial [Pseudomonadota bacterium]